MVLRLLFLGEEEEGDLASSSPISRGNVMMDPDPDEYLYKQINIKMIIINSLPILIKTLASAAQCFAC